MKNLVSPTWHSGAAVRTRVQIFLDCPPGQGHVDQCSQPRGLDQCGLLDCTDAMPRWQKLASRRVTGNRCSTSLAVFAASIGAGGSEQRHRWRTVRHPPRLPPAANRVLVLFFLSSFLMFLFWFSQNQ